MTLERGKRYNWKGQKERLVYCGKHGSWHQFTLVGDCSGRIWCEVLDADLHMIEETVTEKVE